MKLKNTSASVIALLGSSATLICCVLPALFVTLGFGSVVAGFVGAFPQITWLSENKAIVFVGAALLVIVSGFWEWKRKNDPCPLDPKLAKACADLRRLSFRLWLLSALLLVLSATFVFVLPLFFG